MKKELKKDKSRKSKDKANKRERKRNFSDLADLWTEAGADSWQDSGEVEIEESLPETKQSKESLIVRRGPIVFTEYTSAETNNLIHAETSTSDRVASRGLDKKVTEIGNWRVEESFDLVQGNYDARNHGGHLTAKTALLELATAKVKQDKANKKK
jgi:hypothetical protein